MTSESKKAYMKQWREQNKEHLKQYNSANHRRWREAHREDLKKYWARYRLDNHGKLMLYQKLWRGRNPIRYRKHALMKKFGLTVETYNKLLTDQSGVCAICHEASTKTLHVDHDHTSGKVRGLLCHNCNLTLGRMKDNPETLRAAAEYIEFFRLADLWRAA